MVPLKGVGLEVQQYNILKPIHFATNAIYSKKYHFHPWNETMDQEVKVIDDIFKLDFFKAYNKAKWEFLFECMDALCILKEILTMTKTLFTEAKGRLAHCQWKTFVGVWHWEKVGCNRVAH